METKIIFWGSSRAIVGVSCPTRNLECIAVSHRRTANGWQPKQRCWQRRLSRIKRNEAGGTKSKAHPKKAKRKWENPTLRAQRMSSFFWVKDGTFPRQKIFCQKIGIFFPSLVKANQMWRKRRRCGGFMPRPLRSRTHQANYCKNHGLKNNPPK